MTDEQLGDHDIWARATLVIRSAALSIDEIARKVGQATTNPRLKNVWVADLKPDSRVPLDDQLAGLEQFLTTRIEALSELAATSEIYLHLGWTPKTGQDHLIFTRTLISLLNRINADVALDTTPVVSSANPTTRRPASPLTGVRNCSASPRSRANPPASSAHWSRLG